MTLNTKLTVKLEASLSNALDLSTPLDALSYIYRSTLTSGTASGTADMSWHDQRTLAASATENLDLAGVLADAFGATQTFATVKAVIVGASSSNTNNVNVASDGTNGVPLFLALGDGIAVKPGGLFMWFAPATGVTVTPSTGDLLVVTNSAGSTSVTYDVMVIGTSA